jgi:hypothetical protein
LPSLTIQTISGERLPAASNNEKPRILARGIAALRQLSFMRASLLEPGIVFTE